MLVVRRRDISPGASSASRGNSQLVHRSSIFRRCVRAHYDRTFIHSFFLSFFRAFFSLQHVDVFTTSYGLSFKFTSGYRDSI